MIRHRHGLHCLHIHGWMCGKWCFECRTVLGHFHAPENEPPKQAFEHHVDALLALQVCLDMEAGLIAIPAEFANLDLSERVDWPPVASSN